MRASTLAAAAGPDPAGARGVHRGPRAGGAVLARGAGCGEPGCGDRVTWFRGRRVRGQRLGESVLALLRVRSLGWRRGRVGSRGGGAPGGRSGGRWAAVLEAGRRGAYAGSEPGVSSGVRPDRAAWPDGGVPGSGPGLRAQVAGSRRCPGGAPRAGEKGPVSRGLPLPPRVLISFGLSGRFFKLAPPARGIPGRVGPGAQVRSC